MTHSATHPGLHAQPNHGKPPILHVDAQGDVAAWAAEQREALRATVIEHGSLLVRGLGLREASDAVSVFRELGTLMPEHEAFAERRVYAPGVYSATKWPPNQGMCAHNELSYSAEFPGLMLFACLKAATHGGATPLFDAAATLETLPTGLVERFKRTGWLLVRNYNDDIGASLDASFGTGERSAVESYCLANGIKFEWQPNGGLRTWQRRTAVVRHPLTGQLVWFNQAAFLNEWTMNPEVREYLVDEYGVDGLPFNTHFGDGAAIGIETVDLINAAYDANAVRERWQNGDLLLVDNLRTAHGREAFEGAREVIVGLADPVRLPDHSMTAV